MLFLCRFYAVIGAPAEKGLEKLLSLCYDMFIKNLREFSYDFALSKHDLH